MSTGLSKETLNAIAMVITPDRLDELIEKNPELADKFKQLKVELKDIYKNQN